MPFASRSTARKPFINDINKVIGLDWTDNRSNLYTPTLSATTTNPTLGTGSQVAGKYIHLGYLVILRFVIQFGTTGSNAGSGIYFVSTPSGLDINTTQATEPNNEYTVIGTATASDWDVSAARALFTVTAHSATAIRFWSSATNSSGSDVNDNYPWGWDDEDRFGGTVWYETNVEGGYPT